jgi:hypothetical protein
MSSIDTQPLENTSGTVRTMPVALATAVGAIALNALGIFADGSDGAEHSPAEFWVISGLIVLATAVVFGLVVPRYAGRSAGVGLALATAGLLLLVPVFWSGLPAVLGSGGVVLGLASRRTRRSGAATAAVAVGALALIGYVAIYLLDWMATNNIAPM